MLAINTLNLQKEFNKSCRKGKLKLAKWLIKLKVSKDEKIKINNGNDKAFIWACRNGHLYVAKWLIELEKTRNEKIQINNCYDAAFRYVCRKGHLEVAKWLIELEATRDEKIYINNYDPFAYYAHIANTFYYDNITAFVSACEKGHLEIAKWLIKLESIRNEKIQINNYNDYAFRWSYENGHLDVSKWLIELESTRDEKFSKKTLKYYYKYINTKELRKRNITIEIENCNCKLENMYDYYNSKCKNCIEKFRKKLIDEIHKTKNMIYFHPDSKFRLLDKYINIETSYFKPSEKEVEKIKNIFNLEEEKSINNTMRDFTVYF